MSRSSLARIQDDGGISETGPAAPITLQPPGPNVVLSSIDLNGQ